MLLLVAVGAAFRFVDVRSAVPTQALGHGLALTPPMGWNDWNAYGCSVSESLVKQTADKMVASGRAAAGYQYVNIDERWTQSSRDTNGNLQPDSATVARAPRSARIVAW